MNSHYTRKLWHHHGVEYKYYNDLANQVWNVIDPYGRHVESSAMLKGTGFERYLVMPAFLWFWTRELAQL